MRHDGVQGTAAHAGVRGTAARAWMQDSAGNWPKLTPNYTKTAKSSPQATVLQHNFTQQNS